MAFQRLCLKFLILPSSFCLVRLSVRVPDPRQDIQSFSPATGELLDLDPSIFRLLPLQASSETCPDYHDPPVQ